MKMSPARQSAARRAGLLIMLLAAACSSAPGGAPGPNAPGGATSGGPGTPGSGASSAPARPLGEACTAPQPFTEGDCGKGMRCLAQPGGYCASLCGLEGPCSGVCAESAGAGDICLKGCSADKDCREGYLCDPTWKACTVPGFLAPKAPVCQGAPLARKRFGRPVQLSTAKSPGRYTLEPSAAVARDGSLVAAYLTYGKRDDPNPLGVSSLSVFGAVNGDRVLTSERPRHFDPWMASDRTGKLHLVWLGHDGGTPDKRVQIGYANSDDGKTWSKPIAAHHAAADCPGEAPGCMNKPMIAVGPDPQDPKKDAIYVAYFSEVAGALKMTRSSDGGQTFAPSVPVGAGAYGDIEVSADGVVHAVFLSVAESPGGIGRPDRFGDRRHVVLYAASTDGGKTFSKPQQVSVPGEPVPFYFSNPQVAYDVKRKLLYVVYPTGTPDGRWDILLATSKDGGAKWSHVKVNDDAPCANHRVPNVAVSPRSGKVHVLWTENRSGKGQVIYAQCRSGGASCAPNEAVHDAPFASYSLSRFTPSWIGEYGSLVVDERRRKLHAVYTATVDEGGLPVARIFAASAPLD